MYFAQGLADPRKVVGGTAAGDQVEDFPGKRQIVNVGQLEGDIRNAPCRAKPLRLCQHLRGQVNPDDGAYMAREREGGMSRPGRDIQNQPVPLGSGQVHDSGQDLGIGVCGTGRVP